MQILPWRYRGGTDGSQISGAPLTDPWLAFLGGVLAPLVAGLIASLVQRNNETRRRRAETRLDIYFRLLELHQHYFWVASAEVTGEKRPKEALAACRRVAWEIADKLRTFDSVEHLDETLAVL